MQPAVITIRWLTSSSEDADNWLNAAAGDCHHLALVAHDCQRAPKAGAAHPERTMC
jgi:hypothetical protein